METPTKPIATPYRGIELLQSGYAGRVGEVLFDRRFVPGCSTVSADKEMGIPVPLHDLRDEVLPERCPWCGMEKQFSADGWNHLTDQGTIPCANVPGNRLQIAQIKAHCTGPVYVLVNTIKGKPVAYLNEQHPGFELKTATPSTPPQPP